LEKTRISNDMKVIKLDQCLIN